MSRTAIEPTMARAAAELTMPRTAVELRALVPKSPSDAIRWLGALLLAGATASFLLNGLEQAGSVTRYVALLGLTTTLVLGGLFAGLRLDATRTARLMFGIALGSLPVHFAALGGMVVSLMPSEGVMASTTLWDIESTAELIVAAALAVVVLPPLVGLSLRTLTRGLEGRLLPTLLAVHVVLLVPSREDAVVGHLAALTLIAAAAANQWVSRGGEVARTFEALATRALLFLPPVILTGRQVVFYDGLGVGWLPLLLASGLLLSATRRVPAAAATTAPACGTRLLDVAIGGATATSAALWTLWFVVRIAPFEEAAPLAIAAFGLASLLLGEWMQQSRTALRYVGCLSWSGLLVVSSLFDLTMTLPHLLAAGCLMFVWGTIRKARALFIIGALTCLSTVVRWLDPNFGWSHFGGTLPLAALGLTALLIAAVLERHGTRLRRSSVRVGRRFLAWEH